MIGRHGRAAAEQAARREQAGEPVVRDNTRQSLRRGWSYVCPFTGCWIMHTDFETADACRAGWVAHARDKHPGQPVGWPVGTPGAAPGPFTGYQPVPEPRTRDGLQALIWSGALVLVDGVPAPWPPRPGPSGQEALF